MQQPSKDDQRNLILAAVLSFAVIALWQFLVISPQVEEQRRAAELAAIEEQARLEESGEAAVAPSGIGGGGQGGTLDRETALAQSPRIDIDSPRLQGSLSLQGGRIDELLMTDYRVSLEEDSEAVELLWPEKTGQAYYAEFGWQPEGGAYPTPGPRTEWARETGEKLAPGSPVTLYWDNGEGLVFRRTISLDENYLFTISQSVENRTSAPVRLAPYGIISRHGTPQLTGFWILHEGAVGVLNEELFEYDYDDMAEFDVSRRFQGRAQAIEADPGGWIGFTDKYWMTALVPANNAGFEAVLRLTDTRSGPIYQAATRMPAIEVAPNASAETSSYFFAGAKEIGTLRDYAYKFDDVERPDSVIGNVSDYLFGSSRSRFTDAIDWGWFFFLTKPIFEILAVLNDWIGNMGVAIILLTVIVKTLLFPLAWKSYVSMSKLKKLQPEMKKIQERHSEDRTKMQQEMMHLYKKEKVNPAAGCLPILAQIPIFFSLYKVIFVTIEVRHAPFFGWVQDLSAPDPTSLFNLFGLLPYEVPAFLLIGVWPILMGISMWVQQMLNPAPTDPMQEKIFNLLPLLFTFLLGTFAAGLVIYWFANNVLTIIQQYTIMRSQGVNPDILGNMKRQLGLAPKEKPS